MVLRDRDGILRAQSNVCLHRMSVLLEGAGHVNSIVCPYHGWTYALDGHLRAAAAMKQNETFDHHTLCLPQIRCVDWLGWIMVTLNRTSPTRAAVCRSGKPHRRLRHGELHRGVPRRACVEHELEGAGREFHGELTPARLPCRTIGGPFETRRDGVSTGARHLQLSHHPQGRPAEDRACPSHQHEAVGDRRRMTYLLAIYPSLLITLTPATSGTCRCIRKARAR